MAYGFEVGIRAVTGRDAIDEILDVGEAVVVAGTLGHDLVFRIISVPVSVADEDVTAVAVEGDTFTEPVVIVRSQDARRLKVSRDYPGTRN